MGQPFDALSFEDRLATYRGLAEEALYQAARVSDTDLHASYLSIAASWQRLAEEMERIAHRFDAVTEAASLNEAAKQLRPGSSI